MRKFIIGLAMAFSIHQVSAAEIGVTESEILLGSVNAITGPSGHLGEGANRGARAFIQKINNTGGVFGRKLRLITEDDAYEPNVTDLKIKKLIETDRVFALLNGVGTPTTKVALPHLEKADLPLVGVVSGAQLLRQPVIQNVFNIRASYEDETETIVARLTEGAKIREIGLLVQDDAYGNAGLSATVKALEKRGLRPQGVGRFPRNSAQIKPAFEIISKARPKAVILVGGPQACAEFLKEAKEKNFSPKFLNLSFVGTEAYIKVAGKNAEDTIITQVIPSPSSDVPIARQYREDMKSSGGKANLDYATFEGYINAYVLVEAIRAAGKDLTRKSLRAALEKIDVDLGGYRVKFTPQSHDGNSQVFVTKVKGGQDVSLPPNEI